VNADTQYRTLPRPQGGLKHHYGSQVHILSQPYAMSLLNELCAPETHQPRVNGLVNQLYDWLLAQVADREFPTAQVERPTRMQQYHPEGVYIGEQVDRATKAVVVDIARAGILPGLRFYEGLNHLLAPENVRQDHIFMNRATDAEGRVTGVNLSGSKIGGPVDDAVVLIPDPMAATGSSTSEVLRLYRDEVEGSARSLVVVHLIVTPQYLRRITTDFPDVRVYAVRLDRGLSAPEVFETLPGESWSQENGLNDQQYIVPGGGGFGEVMNNAWV